MRKNVPGSAGQVGGATKNSSKARTSGSGSTKAKPKPATGGTKAGTASPSGGRARPSRAGLPKGAPYGATPGNAGANRPKAPTAKQKASMDAYRAANPRTAGTGSRPSGRISKAAESKGKYVVGGAMAGLAGVAAGGVIASRNQGKRYKNGDKAVRGGKQVTYYNGSWYSN